MWGIQRYEVLIYYKESTSLIKMRKTLFCCALSLYRVSMCAVLGCCRPLFCHRFRSYQVVPSVWIIIFFLFLSKFENCWDFEKSDNPWNNLEKRTILLAVLPAVFYLRCSWLLRWKSRTKFLIVAVSLASGCFACSSNLTCSITFFW